MGTGLGIRIAKALGPERGAAALQLLDAAKRKLQRIVSARNTQGAAVNIKVPRKRFRNAVYDELIERPHFQPQRNQIETLFSEWEARGQVLNEYDCLGELVKSLDLPYYANYQLAEYEFRNNIEFVRSLPSSVAMDLTSVCNVQCKFCKYTHHHVPKAFLPVEHIKRIEWFKHILYLNFSAGTAESIIHPQFGEIFSFVRDSYPHLHLTLLTNGRSLVEKRLEEFRGRLDRLHISMNASNRDDYDRVIYKGDWDKFSANMHNVKRILSGAPRPEVIASFCMMRWNIDRAIECLEFAAAHGAHVVSFSHFYSHYIPDLHSGDDVILSRKFNHQDSLYFEREKSDEIFARVVERGKELGVEVSVPPPFAKTVPVYFGTRLGLQPPQDCSEPWHHLFLLWGWKSRREEATICCGLASDIGAFFDREEIKTVAGLREFWNGPILRGYRRTVNGADINPICAMCRKLDRFDPNGAYLDQADFFRYVGLPVPEHLRSADPPADLHMSSTT
jgi:MoaA/NifB/PqqE/SkfB family radical SAM enzyme